MALSRISVSRRDFAKGSLNATSIAAISAGAYRDLTGREPSWNGVPGATDGTFLSAWKGIPCLVNGPGPRHMPHQADEYVAIEELAECAKIYVVAVARFLAEDSGSQSKH